MNINKEKEEIKPRGFRLSDSVTDKFKEITKDLGGNQQHAFKKLLEVYEKEMGRSSISGMQEDIDAFEGYVSTLSSMYLTALQNNQNMKTLVKEEFRSKLESKDQTIEELQKRVVSAEQIANGFSEKEAAYEARIAEITEQCTALEKLATGREETIQNMQAAYEKQLIELSEKMESTISSYNKKLESSERQNDDLRVQNTKINQALSESTKENSGLSETKIALKAQVDALTDELTRKSMELKKYEAQIDTLREESLRFEASLEKKLKEQAEKVEFEKEKALFELEKKLRKEYEAKIDAMQDAFAGAYDTKD